MTFLFPLLFILSLTTPDPQRTPGIARSDVSTSRLCSTKWGRDARHVTVQMRKSVFAAYGIAWSLRRLYEVDHLIPRELAGADDIRNLWPQPLQEAYVKDVVENRFHRLVCTGQMSLTEAQQAIKDPTRWGTK